MKKKRGFDFKKILFFIIGILFFIILIFAGATSPIINNYTPTNSYQSIFENQSILFNITNCTDADGDDLTYNFTLDGSLVSSEQNFTFNGSLYQDGIFTLKGYCWDNSSNNDSQTWTIEVNTTSYSKTFLLLADTHFGDTAGDGSSNDINYTWAWMKTKNPDFVLHIGDITSRGYTPEFTEANNFFDDLIQNTNIEKIWFTYGGNHDGYNNKLAHWTGAQFQRDQNLTSLWYTIKKGNNVFIFTTLVQQRDWWESDWDQGTASHLITRDKINWLESELNKYNNTENNIFVITHTPPVHTNIYTDTWAQMQNNAWKNTSTLLLDLFDRYRVDVFISGHVHIDPDKAYGDNHENVSAGNILIRGFRNDLPNTTFLHATDVDWEHGETVGINSNYPSVMYFKMIEGNNYFDIRAVRTDTNESVGITANNSGDENPYIRIPLSYNVTGMDSDNNIDFFEQDWGVWEYSNETAGDYQWYKDSEGLRVNTSEWITSRWDLWEEEHIDDFEVNWTGENATLSHEFYCSDDGMSSWNGPYNEAADLGNCRWIQVNTTIDNPTSAIYIYEMDFDTAPAVTLISPSNTETENRNIVFNYRVTDRNDIESCSIYLNNVLQQTNSSITKGSTQSFNLNPDYGNYAWNIKCTNSLNEIGISGTNSLIIKELPIASGGRTTYQATQEKVKEGYTKKISIKDKIKFELENENHEIEIIELTEDYIKINLSNNLETLLVGETKKFKITNDAYYDLSITFNSIEDEKANLTIKQIYEEIPEEQGENENVKKEKNHSLLITLVILFLIFILFKKFH